MPDELDDWIARLREDPDDEAPRLILADWLDEETYSGRREQEAADWRWYWQTLIPRFRSLLTKPPLAFHYKLQPLGAYYPTMLFRGMKSSLHSLWATALLRTFPDQGGTPIWERVSSDYKTYVVEWENKILLPTHIYQVGYDDRYNSEDLDATIKLSVYETRKHNGRRIYNEIQLIRPEPRLHTLADTCIYRMPPGFNRIEQFLATLHNVLIGWEQRETIAKTMDQPIRLKYYRDRLYPGFVSETLNATIVLNERRTPVEVTG